MRDGKSSVLLSNIQTILLSQKTRLSAIFSGSASSEVFLFRSNNLIHFRVAVELDDIIFVNIFFKFQ